MRSFCGFPPGKTRFTPIPDLFYTELLPGIDNLGELKLTLYMFWSLNRQRGYPRYLTLRELEAEGPLLTALAREESEALRILREAISRAVNRGTLIHLRISDENGAEDYYFLNTHQGRKAVQEVKQGELVLEKTGHVEEAHLEKPRLNIYELYEQNIGLLKPLLAEELLEAEQSYPAQWIEEAFQIAVEANVHNWRYIRGILERWEREGRNRGHRFPYSPR